MTCCLDYECYPAMALKPMSKSGGLPCHDSRLGRMPMGATSVAIVVTAPHRELAFEAARSQPLSIALPIDTGGNRLRSANSRVSE